MSLLRVALGQGGLVFALGPMTGAEFALFTFSMIPDPKTSPTGARECVMWGLAIAVLDGVLRFLEIRYSMFYALFALCAALPLFRLRAARRGVEERNPWRVRERVLGAEALAVAPANGVAAAAPVETTTAPNPGS